MNIINQIQKFQIIQIIKEIFAILNNISFFTYFSFASFFVLLNLGIFTSSGIQAEALRNTIVFLFLFAVVILGIAYAQNPKKLKEELLGAKGFLSLFTFFSSFMFFSYLFISSEGQLDSSFVYGILTNSLYLLTYMVIVAGLEEFIFRVGIVDIMKNKTENRVAVYFLASLIFSLYHIYKYDFTISSLVFAFLSGLVFTFLKEKQDMSGFPTLPIAIALHLTYNLYSVGALNIALSIFGA